MADDGTGAPLSRRVPGAARRGPGKPAKPVLSDSVISRMQAAIHAERAQAEPHEEDPNTEPLPRVTALGPAGHRGAKRRPLSPSGAVPDVVQLPDLEDEPEPEAVAEPPLRVAKALRAVESAPLAGVPPEPTPAVPEPPAAAARPAAAAVSAVPVESVYPSPSPLAAVPEPPVAAAWPAAAVSNPPVEPPHAPSPPPAAEPAYPTRPLISAGPDPEPMPGTIGWLWPEETPTRRGGGGPRWRPPGRWRYRAATLITLAAGGLVGAGLFIGIALHSTPVAGALHGNSSPKATARPAASADPTPSIAPSPAANTAGLATSLTEAVTWVSQQLTAGTAVACDNQTCAELTAAGFPAAQQVQIQVNPESLANASVVVVDPAVRAYLSTNPSLANYVTPTVLASFGQVTIQVVDLDGAAAYETALSDDVQARIQLGEQLLNSGFISASATATSELQAGEVDSRLLLMLQALCNQEPIDILAFGDSGPGASQGVPFRGVQLAEFDANAEVSRSAYLQVMQQVLSAQATFPAYQKAGPTVADGQTVIQVEYGVPSPLGLLDS